MIGGLVDYILAAYDEEGRDKLAFAGSRNFLTTTVSAQKREMISLAEESIQSRMPVTHWILSWQENEQPTREQVDEAVSLFLRGMGLAEHQTLYALHKNTGNYHMHIVVNRTHPYTQKVIQPHRGFDINEAHKIIAEIEHRQGWASQMNARYCVNEQGHVVRNIQHRAQAKPKPRAEDFESATGEKSAQRIAQERGHAVIRNALCWEELHAGLDAVGLRFVRKGSGAVIFVGDTAVKASSVDRNFGMSRQCRHELTIFQYTHRFHMEGLWILHCIDMIFRITSGVYWNLSSPAGKVSGEERPKITDSLSMLFSGSCAQEHPGGIFLRNTETGKIPIGDFVVGVTREYGNIFFHV